MERFVARIAARVTDQAAPEEIVVPVEIHARAGEAGVGTPVLPPPRVAGWSLDIFATIGIDERKNEDVECLYEELDRSRIVRLTAEREARVPRIRLTQPQAESNEGIRIDEFSRVSTANEQYASTICTRARGDLDRSDRSALS